MDNSTNCSNTVPLCYESNVEFIGYMYIKLPLSLFGVMTNGLTILTLGRCKFPRKSSTYILLYGLAVADMCTCVVILPIGLCRCFEQEFGSWQMYAQQIYDIYFYLPLANWMACVSVWITVTVSFERYMSVTFPLRALTIWTPFCTKSLISGIFVCGLFLNLPYYFLKQISDTPPPVYTPWGTSNDALIFSIIRSLLTKIIPIWFVLIINILLIVSLRKVQRQHKNLTGQEGESNQIKNSVMVLTISFIFLFCNFMEPFSHTAIFRVIFGDCKLFSEGHRTLILVTNSLETINFSTNFFILCAFNREFLTKSRTLLTCCIIKSNDVNVIDSEVTRF